MPTDGEADPRMKDWIWVFGLHGNLSVGLPVSNRKGICGSNSDLVADEGRAGFNPCSIRR